MTGRKRAVTKSGTGTWDSGLGVVRLGVMGLGVVGLGVVGLGVVGLGDVINKGSWDSGT